MDVSAVLEIIGVVAFSMVGVFVGIEYELDVFGIFVVSLCSALGGGIIRDLVLGVTPPVSFVRPVYTLTVLVTVVASLILFKIVDKRLSRKSVKILKKTVDFFDAVGLGVFAINGCQAAIELGYADNFIMIVFVGAVTGVGGGMIRDVLSGRKPIVLRKEVYALAAIVGSILYFFIHDKLNHYVAVYICAGLITVIRVLASWRRINISYAIKNADLKIDE